MKCCVFCDIIAGKVPACIIKKWTRAIAFVPLNPVTAGHMLIVPKIHVKSAQSNMCITGQVFQYAAEYAKERHFNYNLITSCGEAATQTILHFHVHVIPRFARDGLKLPWASGM